MCLRLKNVEFAFTANFLILFQGSHGFMTTHRWRDTVGAFINIEATGTGGFGKLFKLPVYFRVQNEIE